MEKVIRQPSLIQAFIPIVFLICLLGLNVYFFGDDTLSGSNQIGLILATGVAGIIAARLGFRWNEIKEGMVNSISSAMPSILILFLIGSLAGTWMISGVVPALIFYGLKILDPVIFLFAAAIISAIISVSTGSSWSTVATIGIALLGIGKAMGISEGIVAGAIISGAYFGDKMSPLSDTTNLAPAMAGTDIFTHIRYMTHTTIPSILISLLIFLIIGFTYDFGSSTTDISAVLNAIDSNFNITPWLFLVPAFLIFIIIKKVPPLPALLAGTLLGAIFALIFQPDIVKSIAGIGDNMWKASYVGIMKSMFGKISIITQNEAINELLSTKGMAGMLNTIWLIIAAMAFGGIMETSGMLRKITSLLIRKVQSTGSLVASTVGTCIFFNLTASDQYLAIVVPGRMFASTYKEKGYKPELLSRTLEDSGTVTSVLIPWNTCGATQSGVLGVSVMAYAPFAFFCLISPLMTILFAVFNIKIRRIKSEEEE
ncbi:Na+/H+ antiporter NhaC [Bacteroidota bacterium]